MGKIDLGYLIDITGGDKEVMVEMIDLLLEEAPKHITNIKSFHSDKEWAKLGAEAHKLKPMMLYVGLTELNKIAKELEDNGKVAQNLDDIPDLIQKLEDGFNNVVNELNAKKSELT